MDDQMEEEMDKVLHNAKKSSNELENRNVIQKWICECTYYEDPSV